MWHGARPAPVPLLHEPVLAVSLDPRKSDRAIGARASAPGKCMGRILSVISLEKFRRKWAACSWMNRCVMSVMSRWAVLRRFSSSGIVFPLLFKVDFLSGKGGEVHTTLR